MTHQSKSWSCTHAYNNWCNILNVGVVKRIDCLLGEEKLPYAFNELGIYRWTLTTRQIYLYRGRLIKETNLKGTVIRNHSEILDRDRRYALKRNYWSDITILFLQAIFWTNLLLQAIFCGTNCFNYFISAGDILWQQLKFIYLRINFKIRKVESIIAVTFPMMMEDLRMEYEHKRNTLISC